MDDGTATPSPTVYDRLEKSLREKTARVGVVGLGYVGLPLAQAFLDAGFPVIGFDVDPVKIRKLHAGEAYIRHVPFDLFTRARDEGQFDATDDLSRLTEPDVVVVCVPTPLTSTRDPDTSYLERTAEAIGAVLRRGQLVVIESTTYPGTTAELVRPRLDRSGLACGTDWFLAYSPEREDPGNPEHTARRLPKVVGGVDTAGGDLAEHLYRGIVPSTVRVSSTDVAEAAKILENIYRAVNIALVNELKVLFDAMGINVWEVIDAAATKPFGFQRFDPGPGLGGHCIPIDPFYLAWKARHHGLSTRFIELAGEINRGMPAYVVERTVRALNDRGIPARGAKVLLLGMAYKKNVDDPRESPGMAIAKILRDRGAEVAYHDPFLPTIGPMREYDFTMDSIPLTPESVAARDAVILVTAHDGVDHAMVVREAKLVVDTRNATSGMEAPPGRILRA